MILFTILLLISIILLIFGIVALSVFGAGALIVFGDIIICLFIIGLIVKKIFFSKKNKRK